MHTYTDAKHGEMEGAVFFNLCHELVLPSKCLDMGSLTAVFVPKDSDICIELVSEISTSSLFTFIDPEAPLVGFKINNQSDAMGVELRCGDNQTVTLTAEDNNIIIEGSGMCGYMNEPARFYQTRKYVIGIAFILIGLALATMGGYLWTKTAWGLGFTFGVINVFVVYWTYLSFKPNDTEYFMVTILAFIVGSVTAHITKSYLIMGYVFLAFDLGFLITNFLLIALRYSGPHVS